MTIEQLYEEWLPTKIEKVKPSTLSCYVQCYKKWVLPYWRGKDMSQGISNKEMQEFINWLIHENGRSVKYAQDIKTSLIMILQYGVNTYDIPEHRYHIEYPSRNLEKKRQISFFTKADCEKIVSEMKQNPSPKMLGMCIGIMTGLRLGEICGLRFSDIDFDNGTIHVARTVFRQGTAAFFNKPYNELFPTSRGKSLVAGPPKTIGSDRIVPLTPFLLKWLKLYYKTNTPERFVLSCATVPESPDNYRSNFYKKKLRELGLPILHPHCMRHTFATQMLKGKVDVATIASILGHSSPAITLEIYSHTDEEEKKKQVAAVFGKMTR